MKKKELLFFLLLGFSNIVLAQGITFEQGSFEEALTKAETENKLLFVDVYTSWCGPCKKMAKEVFTRNEVGDYFNRHFINYKQDGEKGCGPELMKKYNIKAVPTFLFLDPQQNLVLTIKGFHTAKDFLKAAPNVNFFRKYGGMAQVEIYKKGNGSVDFFKDYYEIAPEEEKPEILNHYLSAMTDQQLIDPESGSLIGKISLYNPQLFQRIAQNIAQLPPTAPLEYFPYYIQPFENKIGTFLEESIQQGKQAKFRELLKIKKILNRTKPVKNDIQYTLMTASDDLLNLWYDAHNKVNPEKFRKSLDQYMSTLIQANPTDSLQANCENIVFRIHHPDTSWMGQLLQSQINYQDLLIWTYRPISNLIVEWTAYYWRTSPSEKEVHKRCLSWLEYACKANPYNPETVVKAAPLLVRLKEKKAAGTYVRKVLGSLQAIGYDNEKDLRELQSILDDIENDKL